MTAPVTTAMVLAAGLGKRMRPLTDQMPKPMVPLSGRPLIDHVLERLSEAGIMRAVVNVHYKAGVLMRHLAERARPEIVISDECDALLDTGGGIVRALPLLGDAPFLVHNSDSVWVERNGCNLSRLIATWDPQRMDCLMLLASVAESLGYHGRGDFVMSDAGRLSRRPSDGDAPFVFAGVSIAHPRMFERVGAGSGKSVVPFSLNAAWDRALEDKRLFGMRLEGTWMHVGTPEALTEAEACISRYGRT